MVAIRFLGSTDGAGSAHLSERQGGDCRQSHRKCLLSELSKSDEVFDFNVAHATFAPGAKLDWHIHPGGQILMITEGAGYYQEKGKPVQIVQKGDVIKCPPGIAHWHGATPGSTFAYIAVSPTQKGETKWLQRVTDEEYRSADAKSKRENDNQ